eukprot:CCRYP_020449-RA/>CCRYP_020449-RA protein AED:0.12 eAED:0.12 QI:270/1/1/1/1/1/2/312/526
MADHKAPRPTAAAARPSSLTTTGSKGGGEKSASSGFVLKLYQMVNGAPDDILSWVSNGEAFRISDLSRLESETLPSYFRHSRFQSLVRQLNFYNFRKVNRERTFWVYHHPLFHRDRPHDLKKLRRRTCPGFDGRKQKMQARSSAVSTSYDDQEEEEDLLHDGVMDTAGGASIVSPESIAGAKVSRSPSPSSSSHSVNSEHLPSSNALVRHASFKSVTSEVENSLVKDGFINSFYRTVSSASCDRPIASSSTHISGTSDDEVLGELTEEEIEERQAHLHAVAEVSRDLDVICSDLAATCSSHKTHHRGRGRNARGIYGGNNTANSAFVARFGLDKSEMHYSRIKCDLLTYDDEDDVLFQDGKTVISQADKCLPGLSDPNMNFAKEEVDFTPPSQDDEIITSITNACREGCLLNSSSSSMERSISSSVLRFFLSTHPQDPHICGKIVTHLKSYPNLCEEFNAYCKALDRGISVSEDLTRDWFTYSSNQIRHIVPAIRSFGSTDALAAVGAELSGIEFQTIKRCCDLWF